MKKTGVLCGWIGFLLIVYLVNQQGLAEVASSVSAVGLSIVLLPLLHLLVASLGALAWCIVLQLSWWDHALAFIRAKLVREAVNDLLPVAGIGGNIVGVRLLILDGVTPVSATASVLVDMTLEILTQFLFAVLGLVFLVGHIGANHAIVSWAVVGSLLAGTVLLGFVFAQRKGLFHWLGSGLERLADCFAWQSAGAYKNLHKHVHALYQAPLAPRWAVLLHFLCWILTALETYVALHLMGFNLDLSIAIIIESLGQAVRSAAFVMPAGLGIQESGYIALGTVLGIPADKALALSLLRRVREVVLGLVALIVWRWRVHRKRTL